MAKLISPHHDSSTASRAKEYLRSHVVFPSALLGIILLIASTMGLIYQYLSETYEPMTFLQSTALAMIGALTGWGQSRYHRYVLGRYPEIFSARLSASPTKQRSRSRRRALLAGGPEHPGRRWVPLWYLLAVATLLGLSFSAAAWGSVYAVSSYLLPWTGFFCARVYSWKELWGPAATSTRL